MDRDEKLKQSNLKQAESGIALLEILGALAIGSIILIGLSSMMDESLDDIKGQQASYYQSQLFNAAGKYINANVSSLQASTANPATVVPVGLAQLTAGHFLPAGFASTNVYGQTPCILVRQPDPLNHPAQFDALIVTTGGDKIPERDIAVIAMNAGQGGGYLAMADPTTAKGGSWSLSTSAYRSVGCNGAAALTGAAADGGHLASSLFYDGPGQLSSDFLYRSAVSGRPELNRMNTPMRLASAALVNVGTSCLNSAGVAEAGLAADATTRGLLSCGSNGLWSTPSQWKEPVSSFGNLPYAGSNNGDVRMVTGINRAFTYSGGAWVALAVDENDNMAVPGTLNAAYLAASQNVNSQGTLSSDGDITTKANVVAINDITANHNLRAGNDVNVGHDVNVANDVFAIDGVSGGGWVATDHISIGSIKIAGHLCNYGGDPGDIVIYPNHQLAKPAGSMVMDNFDIPLFCNADGVYRYANGTTTP